MRVCTTCSHPKREEIDRSIVRGEPLRAIASCAGLDRKAVERHWHSGHVAEALVKAQEAREVARADNLLDLVRTLLERAEKLYRVSEGLIGRAGRADDTRAALDGVRTAAAVMRETRGHVELLAKLEGLLRADTVVNIYASPEWIRLQAALLDALAPYPDARAAAADALEVLDSDAVH